MLIDKEGLPETWDNLRRCAAAAPDAITVMVLAALDVDAVATCATLTNLLQKDEISHAVKAVRDYRSLAEIYVANIVDNSELRFLILLNCGARIDLQDHLQEHLQDHDVGREGGVRSAAELPHPDCTWLVLDSHLPLHLENAAPSRANMLFVKNSEVTDEMEDLLEQARAH